MRLARLTFSFLLPALCALVAHAQSVRWDPPGGTIPVGQTTALRLTFDQCEPNGVPEIPKVADLTMQYAGNNISTTIINGSMTRSDTLTYAIALTKNHAVDIPSFEVETNKGKLRVAAAHFTAGAATVGRTNTPLESAATSKLVVTPASVWAGEVFDLAATVEANRSYYPQFTRGFDWTPDPLIAEAWSEPQQVDFTTGGEPHTGFTYRARALARSPGRYNLNAATHIVSLSVGVSGFGFFQQRQYDQYSITSNPAPTLEIKALPTAPAGFSGAVGSFKLTSKIVPEKATVGEPITWTIELGGTGNWPDIAGLPSRDVSNDFQVVQPKARRTPTEGKIFDVTLTEDVVLVPSKAGTYALGPLNFSYFDPKSGTYKTLTAPRTTVTIAAPAAPLFSINLNKPATDVAPAETPADPATAPRPPVTSPAPPAGIPRDPLPGSADASVPMASGQLIKWLVTPFAGLLVFWIWLALREARRTDPLRARREARTRLAATLAQLRGATPAEQSALLLQWQHDTAILWQISHAAPPATALSDPAWAALWIEADRALYGAKLALPPDWVARAEAAFATKSLPGFQPLRLFLPRNLFPFAAALAFLFLVPRSPLGAEEPRIAYGQGNFAAAEKAWLEQVQQKPTDWIARHNLSLALSQQERTGEAAGHAAAAFVQNPAHPAVRWHLALASEKAGFVPAPLAGFLAHALPNEIARHHSPAQWQFLLIAGAFAVSLALAWILANAYGRRSRLAAVGAIVVLVLSLAGVATAATGLLRYGPTADARAVLVTRAGTLRSIPTEAETAQKTTALAAGSIAVADKTFLVDWIHLTFTNGQTGWVRKEEVVGLWQ